MEGLPNGKESIIENSDQLRKLKLDQNARVQFFLIIKPVPSDALPALTEACREKVLSQMKAWQPKCGFNILNEEEAIRLGLVRGME